MRGATLKMTENPPVVVGTGFAKCFPSLLAGVIGMSIGWNKLYRDS